MPCRISTGMLNDMLAYATARVQPPSDKGKRLKIYYMTQADHSTTDLCLLCQPRRAVPFFLSALSGKSDSGKLRL